MARRPPADPAGRIRTMVALPTFTGPLRKNDALFLYGARKELPWVFSYVQETVEVVHGPSCKPESEVYLDRCAADGIDVVPRRGGGGTVVLAPGTVVIVAVGRRDPREGPRSIFARVHHAVMAVLAPAGLDIEPRGISDLAVDNMKILGSSLYLPQKPPLYCYQSSLLAATDLEILERYLRHPPREPDYRQGRPHGRFCTTLARLGVTVSPAEVCGWIDAGLRDRLD